MTTRVWNNQDPETTNFVYDGDNSLQRTKVDVQERMEVDHQWGVETEVGSDQDGVHNKVTLSSYTGLEADYPPYFDSAISLFREDGALGGLFDDDTFRGIQSYKNVSKQLYDGTTPQFCRCTGAIPSFVAATASSFVPIYTSTFSFSTIQLNGVSNSGTSIRINNSGYYMINCGIFSPYSLSAVFVGQTRVGRILVNVRRYSFFGFSINIVDNSSPSALAWFYFLKNGSLARSDLILPVTNEPTINKMMYLSAGDTLSLQARFAGSGYGISAIAGGNNAYMNIARVY